MNRSGVPFQLAVFLSFHRIRMSRRSIPLAERLRHGLASAVLSAAALAVPSAEAAPPAVPAPRGQAATPPKTSAPKPSPSPKAKSDGCGAHDGGCGPSR
jgi:hypothetical protein